MIRIIKGTRWSYDSSTHTWNTTYGEVGDLGLSAYYGKVRGTILTDTNNQPRRFKRLDAALEAVTREL